MGIFSRRKGQSTDDAGQVSQPQGDGPVTLADRTAPGGEGSPDTNQGKTEPMSARRSPRPFERSIESTKRFELISPMPS